MFRKFAFNIFGYYYLFGHLFKSTRFGEMSNLPICSCRCLAEGHLQEDSETAQVFNLLYSFLIFSHRFHDRMADYAATWSQLERCQDGGVQFSEVLHLYNNPDIEYVVFLCFSL